MRNAADTKKAADERFLRGQYARCSHANNKYVKELASKRSPVGDRHDRVGVLLAGFLACAYRPESDQSEMMLGVLQAAVFETLRVNSHLRLKYCTRKGFTRVAATYYHWPSEALGFTKETQTWFLWLSLLQSRIALQFLFRQSQRQQSLEKETLIQRNMSYCVTCIRQR